MLPKSMQETMVYFSDQDVAIDFLRDIRWPNGVVCPTCGAEGAYYISTQRRWKCKNVHPKQQFSVKVGTIFEDSPVGLDKWLPAAWLVTNCKNGISSYELSRDLKVTQRTAWFMLHRVRHAMRLLSFEKLDGEIQADETFIGGKINNMHKKSKRKIKAVNDACGARAKVAPNRNKKAVHEHLKTNVAPGASLYTDEFNALHGPQTRVRARCCEPLGIACKWAHPHERYGELLELTQENTWRHVCFG